VEASMVGTGLSRESVIPPYGLEIVNIDAKMI